MSKVLVIGLDGATFDIIQPLVADGRLPNLAHILQNGAWGLLDSTIPPITPTAWTSIFTGKNPGKYGIYDFKAFDPQTYDTKTLRIDQHREKAIWNLLGEAGKKSIIVDVPFTYPPQPLEGFMITGYGTPRTPGTTFTYPTNFANHLPTHLHSEIRVAVPTHRFDRSQTFLDEWRQVMDGRRRLLRHLITENEWDFFFHVFTITDNLAHVFWTFVEPSHPNYHTPEGPAFREAFFDGYRQCDALLGDMIEWAGSNTTTLIVSDHGFGSIYPRQYLFQRLSEGGFLHYQSPPFLSIFGDRLMKLAMKTYTRMPFLREQIKNLRPNQQKAMKSALKKTSLMPTTQALDYRRTPVLTSGFGMQMWINEQGRFATGPVTPNEKEALVNQLITYLQADRDSVTQRPIIANVYQGSAVYHGPAIATAPDAIIEYTNFYQPHTMTTHRNPRLEGGHTPQGIFLAYGPDIDPQQLKQATLIDLAPTILYLFDQPIPPDMDGDVLQNIFTDSFRNGRPVHQGTEPAQFEVAPNHLHNGYSREDEKEIEEQLRQLGYLS